MTNSELNQYCNQHNITGIERTMFFAGYVLGAHNAPLNGVPNFDGNSSFPPHRLEQITKRAKELNADPDIAEELEIGDMPEYGSDHYNCKSKFQFVNGYMKA